MEKTKYNPKGAAQLARWIYNIYDYDDREVTDQEVDRALKAYEGLPNEMDKVVISLYFGLANGNPKTLESIGWDVLGVTKERARQVRERALKRMRSGLEDNLETEDK